MQGLAEDCFGDHAVRNGCLCSCLGLIQLAVWPSGFRVLPDLPSGIHTDGEMHVLQRLLANLGELCIHFLAGDGTLLDADDRATAHGPKTRLAWTVDNDLVAIVILARRADDGLDGRIGNLADALEHVTNLAAFQFELVRVLDVLILATGA